MLLNSGNISFIKELLHPVAEKMAPVIDAFQNILAVILISVAVIIALLLLIDRIVEKRRAKVKSERAKVKGERLTAQPPVVSEQLKTIVEIVTPSLPAVEEKTEEEVKIEEPVLQLPVIPEPKIKLPEEAKWFSLKQNVTELSSEYKTRCADKNINFNIELDDRLPEKINGRRNWLNDLLEQLFTNAIEQTTQGGITLKIKMVKRNDVTGVMQFLVTDSGEGLSPSLLRAVQEKNFSFHPGEEKLQAILTRLHSVKWSVEKQGGRLTLASKAGEGSTVGMLLEFGV